jgi:hypothetical protein
VPFDPPDAAPSPQANAEPAQLANVPTSATSTAVTRADAGRSAEALRGDRELEADLPREPRETGREPGARDPDASTSGWAPRLRDTKELSGYSMQVLLRAGEGAPASKGPEVNLAAIDGARRKTELRMAIDVSQTRARFVLSGGFVLPQGTELRSRIDFYGHIVMWPDEGTYRVVEPGALRALLGERRLDVAPLSPATVAWSESDGVGRRIDGAPVRGQQRGVRTRRVEVSTRAAKATLELGTFHDAGEGGVLVCRMLLDLMNAPPSTAACDPDDLPIHAELRWTTQGALTFDVISIVRRADLPTQSLATPPSSAAFAIGAPPMAPGEALLSKVELAAFRTAPADVGPAVARDPQEPAPESGIALSNASDELRVAWVDGVAVAWVAPGGRQWLPSLLRGHYVVQWRTFLGDSWTPPRAVLAPGSAEVPPP